ncbi:MAG TPA: hypothetical protein VM305_02005 [Candidatus Limnocylindrales bacterium]|nr:hypothetical protein [Candidatus Limnocylindrales bacterium]
MPSIGDTSKPSSGFAHAYSGSINQEAEEQTMPERGKITRVGVWAAGYEGSSSARLCIWAKGGSSASGNDLLGQSGLVTFAQQTWGAGNVSRYEADLLTPVELDAGVTFYVGFSRNPNAGHQVTCRSGGDHIERKRTTWPGSMDGWTRHPDTGQRKAIGCYVANYDPVSGAWVRRGGVWVRAEGVFVRRAGAWVDATSVQVRRSGVWVDAD